MTKKSILKTAEQLFKGYQNKSISGAAYDAISYNAGLSELQFLRRYVLSKKCCLSSYQGSFDLMKSCFNI